MPAMRLRERHALAARWLPAHPVALLDAGCNTGEATGSYARRADYTAGVDVDPESVERARREQPGVDFEVATIERLPFDDGRFDAVVCLDVLEHVEDDVAALSELHRVLRPDGTLILTTPHRGMFGFLDPVLVLQRLGRTDEERHRHYTLPGMLTLLDRSAWAGKYTVAATKRSGLLLYPSALWGLANHRLPGWLRRPLEALLEAEYAVPFGRASYCLAVKLVKVA
jgi:SAM-dependent methyltransferase